MRKLPLGLITGFVVGLILSATIAVAAPNIKLVIDGQEVTPDVPPQMINGRVMVPVRFVAEHFGVPVEFKDNTVFIGSGGITTMEKQSTFKVNGFDTGSTSFIKTEDDLFIPARPILTELGKKYGNNVLFRVTSDGQNEGVLMNGQLYELQCTTKDDEPVYSLNSLVNHGLIQYEWDPSSNNVTIY